MEDWRRSYSLNLSPNKNIALEVKILGPQISVTAKAQKSWLFKNARHLFHCLLFVCSLKGFRSFMDYLSLKMFKFSTINNVLQFPCFSNPWETFILAKGYLSCYLFVPHSAFIYLLIKHYHSNKPRIEV